MSEVELHLPQREDWIIHRGGLLWKLQDIERLIKDADVKGIKRLKKQSALIRAELDAALLDRFDKMMERYGFAVAEVDDGACQGCYINVATGMASSIVGSNDIYVCENCGKFLVSSKKPPEVISETPAAKSKSKSKSKSKTKSKTKTKTKSKS